MTSHVRSTALLGLIAASLNVHALAQTASRPAGHAGLASAGSVLYLATSEDGLTFSDAGKAFDVRGAAPNLLRLSNGRLLATFQSPGGGPRDPAILLAAQSRDEGRTWSQPRRIVVRDRSGAGLQLDSPAVCLLPDGTLRMYCRVQTEKGLAIGSAVSQDGINYDWDREFRLTGNLSEDLRPLAVPLARRIVLLLASVKSVGSSSDEAPQFLSTNGRRFYKPARRLLPAGTLGFATLRGGEARAYVAHEGDVRAMTGDGVRWRDEGAARLPGRDFAAVRLDSGKYLMLYARSARSGEKLKAPPADNAGTTPEDEWGPVGAGELAEMPLPPTPDLQTDFDYAQWLQETFPAPADEDNAYNAYAEFMPRPGDNSNNKVPDKIDDMLNGENAGTPGPWDPAQHPNWEVTHQTLAPLLDQFRQAARLDAYQMPLEFTPEQYAKAPGGRPLLFEMLLPSLGPHRKMVRAELADGWRAEGGQVAPDRMIQSWETTLRASKHLSQAPFLITNLVSVAEQVAVFDSVRRGIATGAFSADQLESTLRTLREHGRPPEDSAGWLSSEQAAFMDAWQRICMPTQPGQPAGVNMDVLRQLQMISADPPSGLERLTAEQVQGGLQQAEEYFREIARQWQTGYPAVRAADLKTTENKYIPGNPVGGFLPGVSRAYVMNARCEATRRATQLTCAVQLYQARTGRWPNTLDELPVEWGETMKTDPFTGRQFQYRITPTGPTLYSLSENGTDDGGVHSSRWEDTKDKSGGSDDFVFWPVQP